MEKSNIIEHLPEILQEIEEYVQIAKANDIEIDVLRETREHWRKNIPATTAEIDGIREMEKVLNLTPLPEDTLEDRRLRVIAKLNERLPLTEIRLRRMLAVLCGWDGFDLTVEDLVLTVSLAMENHSQLGTVYDLLQRVVPMNILIVITQIIERHIRLTVGVGGYQNVELTVSPRQTKRMRKQISLNLCSGKWEEIELKVIPRQLKNLNYRMKPIHTAVSYGIDMTVLPRQKKQIAEDGKITFGLGQVFEQELTILPRRIYGKHT